MNAKIVRHLNIPEEFPAPEVDTVFQIDRKAWRNGMIVRMPNHLGDAIMAIPALAGLRSILPQDHGLVVIAPANQKSLYATLPGIVDDVIVLDDIHSFWSIATLTTIRQYRMGVGVLFNNSFRDALSMKLAGVPRLYGYSARCRSILMAGTLFLPRHKRTEEAHIHQANLYYSIARAFGAKKWDGIMPELALDKITCTISNEVKDIASAGNKLLIIASGAAYGAAKRYPTEYYNKIAAYWLRHDGKVAVVGSKSEAASGSEVISGLPKDSAFNLCGKTADLGELIYLISQAGFVVANDSGTMHLGAALDKKGITVFGPTDPTSTSPIAKNWSLIISGAGCRPCLRRTCPLHTDLCMKSVKPLTVIRELRRISK